MKTQTSLWLAGTGLAGLAASFLLPMAGLLPSPAQAQAVVVEGQVPVVPRIEQYKVVDISTIPVGRAAGGPVGTLETVLNGMAAEGWRLREATGNYLIFAR